MENTTKDIKVYFVTIPAHKFLHIKNYESIGYWDFWQKQSLIPGQDCETICGLLDSIKGKVTYFYHDPERFWKYVRPVQRLISSDSFSNKC